VSVPPCFGLSEDIGLATVAAQSAAPRAAAANPDFLIIASLLFLLRMDRIAIPRTFAAEPGAFFPIKVLRLDDV
jgi:hypothetical protein